MTGILLKAIVTALPTTYVASGWKVSFSKSKSRFQCQSKVLLEDDKEFFFYLDFDISPECEILAARLRPCRGLSYRWSGTDYTAVRKNTMNLLYEHWGIFFNSTGVALAESWGTDYWGTGATRKTNTK